MWIGQQKRQRVLSGGRGRGGAVFRWRGVIFCGYSRKRLDKLVVLKYYRQRANMSLTQFHQPNAFEIALRNCVSVAGGKFMGIQDGLFPDQNPRLHFSDKATGKIHTLTVNLNEWNSTCSAAFAANLLVGRIRRELGLKSAPPVERTSVNIPVSDLKQLAAKLLKLSEEIDALYEEKK